MDFKIMTSTRNFLRTLSLTIMLLFALTICKAQKAYPINFFGKTLETAKSDIDNWNGKVIACEVEVVQVEKGYVDKPYYKVKFDDGGYLWVGSLVTSGYEKVGAKLRLLGFFAKVKSDDKNSLKFNKSGFHLLAFAVVDMASKQMSILPDTQKQVQEWINGTIPKGDK